MLGLNDIIRSLTACFKLALNLLKYDEIEDVDKYSPFFFNGLFIR